MNNRHTRTHTLRNTHSNTLTHLFTHTHIITHIHTHARARARTHTQPHTHAQLHILIHTYTRKHMHTYTHSHRHSCIFTRPIIAIDYCASGCHPGCHLSRAIQLVSLETNCHVVEQWIIFGQACRADNVVLGRSHMHAAAARAQLTYILKHYHTSPL